MFSSFSFSFTLLSLLVLTPCSTMLNAIKHPNLPAIIIFGDSIVDTGNNNNLYTVMKCNFPPYGANLEGGVPTGRFSNGKIPSDIIVEVLGIKDYLPAYLDPRNTPEDLLTGVSFASAGTGYDDFTALELDVLSFSDQLRYFKEYKQKLNVLIGEKNTSLLLQQSVFVISASSNDLGSSYFTGPRKLVYDISTYTDLLVNWASDFVKEIYGLGARKIGILGAPPIGSVPAQRTLHGGVFRAIFHEENEAAMMFNSKLSKMLDNQSTVLSNSTLVYIDTYTILNDMILNPKKHGFEVSDRGCCGTGDFELGPLCNHLSPLCSNPSSYVFWDSYHPTEAGYRAILADINTYVDKFL